MSDTINLDVGFGTFLEYVFGKNKYKGLAGNIKKNRWEEILSDLFDSLEKHVIVSIQDDSEQVQNIRKDLELIRSEFKRNKSIDDLNVKTIRVLFGVCFQLLGDEINNTNRKVLNRPSHYRLNKKRTLVYHSDNLQKFWQVHERSGEAKFLDDGLPGPSGLEDFFFKKLNGNADDFILWFKENHPKLYLEMF